MLLIHQRRQDALVNVKMWIWPGQPLLFKILFPLFFIPIQHLPVHVFILKYPCRSEEPQFFCMSTVMSTVWVIIYICRHQSLTADHLPVNTAALGHELQYSQVLLDHRDLGILITLFTRHSLTPEGIQVWSSKLFTSSFVFLGLRRVFWGSWLNWMNSRVSNQRNVSSPDLS